MSGQKTKQAFKVMCGQLGRRIGLDQKVHVRAGRYLRGVVLQGLQKGAGVWRVDDDQFLKDRRVLVGEAPGDGSAPIVRNQGGQRRTAIRCLAFGVDQRHDVLHQVFGAVGFHVIWRAGAFVAAQVGSHAAVTAVFWF